MGFVSKLLGFGNGPGTGGGWQAANANIIPTANADQAGWTYAQGQDAIHQQQAFLNALNAQNGLANQNSVYGQLQDVANGVGPNPAMAQLNQATGQNIANQAALMAGQRGANQNVGLLARLAAQQGANTQQQAVGQGASLQAQQSLSALNQMQNLANTQAGQQQAGLNSYLSGSQGLQGNVLGALGQLNNARVGMQSNTNNANSGIAQGAQKQQGGGLGGALNGIGSMLGSFFAEGGMADGPKSKMGQYLKKCGAVSMTVGGPVPGQANVQGNSLKNDVVPAMLSPKEIVLPRSITMAKDAPEKAAAFVAAILAKNGMRGLQK